MTKKKSVKTKATSKSVTKKSTTNKKKSTSSSSGKKSSSSNSKKDDKKKKSGSKNKASTLKSSSQKSAIQKKQKSNSKIKPSKTDKKATSNKTNTKTGTLMKSGTNKKNTKTATSKKEEKKSTKKSETKNENKKNNKKVSTKPKSKKEYDDDDDLLDTELIDKDEIEEDEEVTEVEELDISNIEPVIADAEPLLDEEEEEYVPKTRGRKKQAQPEVHHQQTLEEIIRNRPLQIDPTQKTYVTKKEDEPKPYIASKTNKERYSDKELQEFKEIILQKLKETKENYDQLKKYFTNEDDNGIDDTSPTFKMIEDGSGVMTKEEIEQQLARLEKYMIDLQNALLRIENKTYGICTVTGKLIPKERLKLVPHATKSIEAKISRDN